MKMESWGACLLGPKSPQFRRDLDQLTPPALVSGGVADCPVFLQFSLSLVALKSILPM